MKKFFLKLIFGIVILGVAGGPTFAHAQSQALLSAAIDASLARLQARYGISFKYAGFPPKPDYVKFDEVVPQDYQKLAAYLSMFEEEIGKYPPGFFSGQGIRGIGLVRRLFLGEKSADGMYSTGARIMFFDIARLSRNKPQQRQNIHHEIFHMMATEKPDFPLLNEETWASFNEPDFVYGKQTKPLSEQNPVNRYAPNQLGFATYYAMTSVVEDQAEVFACLMIPKHRKLVEQWAANDPALAKKVEAIKQFAQYFSPEMGEGYWE